MIGGIQVRFDRKTVLSLAVAVPLAALLLWLTLRNMDLREVWTRLRSARAGWFAAAVAVQVLALVLRAARWRVLLNAEGSLTFGTVFSALSAGYLGNNLLPARMGELIRTAAIAWAGPLSLGYVLATALTERMLDAAALDGVASAALSAAAGMPDVAPQSRARLAIASAAGIAAIVVLPHLERPFRETLGYLPFGARFQSLARPVSARPARAPPSRARLPVSAVDGAIWPWTA